MSKPKLIKLRAAAAYLNQADARIDRDNLIIRDTVAMLANVEALGHGFQTDQRSLEIMLGLSRRFSRGIKMHFGHTGMSENAMGRQIAWAKDFRIDGDKLVHNIHFMEQAAISPAFGQDPIEYILQMTENQPQDIGESVVIETDVVWTLPDGSEVDGFAERPENALTELPVMRPVTFYYVDVVADPALTRDGLLASAMFAGTSSFFSDQAFHLIDDFRSEYNISLEELPRKVQLVLGRYMQARGHRPGADMNKSKIKSKFEEGEGDEGLVSDVLTEPEATETPAVEPAAPAQDEANDVDEALQTAQSTEAALADDAPAEDEPADEPATVPAEQYAAAMKRIDELTAKIDQLAELSSLNAKNNATLAARILALEGEPVVTASVGGMRAFNAPRPAEVGSLRKPTHVSSKVRAQSNQPVTQANPALASLAASQARTGID